MTLPSTTEADGEDWQSMPAPITQRYPALDYRSIGNQAERLASPVGDASDYYTCTESDVSTITDDLALLDVSFLESDIQDALLEP